MTKTVTTIIANQKATEYFCQLQPVQAKKVLFAMTQLTGNRRLGDSNVVEARRIAEFYDGVITANYAKELASNLATEYAKKNPRLLLTKKQVEEYTHAKYRKLYDALGIYGFDYVITALAQGKAYVANPENGIDEKNMLSALRWDERREGVNAETSNDRHRRKGLQLVGLGDMVDVLMPYTFIIASVYELIQPANQGGIATEDDTESPVEEEFESLDVTGHISERIIRHATLLKEFYSCVKPEVPEGYFEEELQEGTLVYSLAQRKLLDEPERVLDYIEKSKAYEACVSQVKELFNTVEFQVITEKAEIVKEILRLVDML